MRIKIYNKNYFNRTKHLVRKENYKIDKIDCNIKTIYLTEVIIHYTFATSK